MNKELNIGELDLAKEIINIALAKAADSLSFFIKNKKILLKVCSVSFEKYTEASNVCTKQAPSVIVLKTEIKGNLNGNCYLFFSEEEQEKITSIVSPGIENLSSEAKTEMEKAILMEIDNIVTASVVTQFSNLLNLKIYGYIPLYHKLKADELIDFIKNDNKDFKSILKIKTELYDSEFDINPEFVWFINHEIFVNCIKGMAPKSNTES